MKNQQKLNKGNIKSKPINSIAMILHILWLINTSCSFRNEAVHKKIPPKWNEKIEFFNNCQEINKYIESYNYPIYQDDSVANSNPVSSNQHYQNQVDGVEEGDILQKSSRYFYYSRPGSIEVMDPKLGTIAYSIPNSSNKTQASLIWKDPYIIAIYSNSEVKYINESKEWKIEYSINLQENLLDYRIVNNELILITQSYLFDVSNKLDELHCSHIYKPNFENGSNRITNINKFSIDPNPKRTDYFGALGDTHFIYLNKDAVFLVSNGYFYSDIPNIPGHIRVLNYKSNSLSQPLELITYKGDLKDRYSIAEINSHLYLATTISSYEESKFQRYNLIQVYKKNNNSSHNQKYHFYSESVPFGYNEDIRSVEFRENKIYIVTFEKTDPLFVFDISNPEQLHITGELKIPGFSTQLRSLNESLFVGLGYDAIDAGDFSWFSGIKLSLFTQNNNIPSELDHQIWGVRGSYSEATFDPKVLSVDSNNLQIAFPLTLFSFKPDTSSGSNSWDSGDQIDFNGAILLQVENNKLSELTRISHANWREPICGKDKVPRLLWWSMRNTSLDIQRIIFTPTTIISFSPFGFKVHNRSSFESIIEVPFSEGLNQCLKYYNTWPRD